MITSVASSHHSVSKYCPASASPSVSESNPCSPSRSSASLCSPCHGVPAPAATRIAMHSTGNMLLIPRLHPGRLLNRRTIIVLQSHAFPSAAYPACGDEIISVARCSTQTQGPHQQPVEALASSPEAASSTTAIANSNTTRFMPNRRHTVPAAPRPRRHPLHLRNGSLIAESAQTTQPPATDTQPQTHHPRIKPHPANKASSPSCRRNQPQAAMHHTIRERRAHAAHCHQHSPSITNAQPTALARPQRSSHCRSPACDFRSHQKQTRHIHEAITNSSPAPSQHQQKRRMSPTSPTQRTHRTCLVRTRILFLQPRRNRHHLRICRLHRDAVLQRASQIGYGRSAVLTSSRS